VRHSGEHDFRPALELFGQVLRRQPDHVDALAWCAAVLTVLADYDGAHRPCITGGACAAPPARLT
jgi:hypothetical protein